MLEIKVSNIQYVSKRLESSTKAIFKCADSIDSKMYEVAHIIAQLASESEKDNSVLSDDGFKNVHEWTENAFGFKKSMSYALLKIGKTYTTKNGKAYSCNLSRKVNESGEPDENGEYEIPCKFTTSQVFQMLSYDEVLVRSAVNNGIITDTMSCREIAKTLKELKKSVDSDSSETQEESAENESTENESAENNEMHFVDVWDKAGVCYRIPFEELEKYMVKAE